MNDNQLSFLDALNVASFMLGIENLRANLTQNDKQDLIHEQSGNTDRVISEIHAHLEKQDRKIDRILKILEEIQNEDNQMSRGDDR